MSSTVPYQRVQLEQHTSYGLFLILMPSRKGRVSDERSSRITTSAVQSVLERHVRADCDGLTHEKCSV